MDTDHISEKVKDFLNKAVDASKTAFDKAGDKVQEISDKGVIKVEKHKLENALNDKYVDLGMYFYALLDNNVALNIDNPDTMATIDSKKEEIKNLLQQIKQKEDLLK